MRRLLPWVLGALIALGVIYYRSRHESGPPLNVEPHAAEEIDKAKRR